MDVAVPANIHQGLHQADVARKGWAFSADEAKGLVGRGDVALVDLREKSGARAERAPPGSLHAPYGELQDNIGEGGLIHELARSRQDDRVLLRVRRALGDGGAGGPGSGARHGSAHRGRNVGLDEGRRSDALRSTDAGA